jgi:N-acetylglucosaminyldiphosphoundecaprenol N-acetyl-beta-D-mannosaminyltransferase
MDPRLPDGVPVAFPVLTVQVHALDAARALDIIQGWIRGGGRKYVCALTVHGVMEAHRQPAVSAAYAGAGLVVPDGMPLVWAGHLSGHPETGRVYGPDLTLALCGLAAREGWSCYFYGGGEGVAEAMALEMRRRLAGLTIAGTHMPSFGRRSAEEDAKDVQRINDSGASIVFVALGCPKQELWMADHRDRLSSAVLVGVGAAFDFHTGRVRQAPRWMMELGLEWAFRLAQEPRRLWYRYLVYNPLFVMRFAWQRLTRRRARPPRPHHPA